MIVFGSGLGASRAFRWKLDSRHNVSRWKCLPGNVKSEWLKLGKWPRKATDWSVKTRKVLQATKLIANLHTRRPALDNYPLDSITSLRGWNKGLRSHTVYDPQSCWNQVVCIVTKPEDLAFRAEGDSGALSAPGRAKTNSWKTLPGIGGQLHRLLVSAHGRRGYWEGHNDPSSPKPV